MKSKNIKLSIIIGLAIIFSLSTTYAYLTINATNNSTSGTAGCFVVDYQNTNFSAENIKSDFEFTTDAPYATISLNKNTNCKIYTKATIKVNILNSTTAPISTYQALKYNIIKGNTSIASGTITAKGITSLAEVTLTDTKTDYKVYFWVDSGISGGAYDKTTISGYIYAESIQQSTIK